LKVETVRTGKGAESGDGRQAATPEIISGEGIGALASKIRDAVAHRAFELFEARGYERGRDLEDWFRAESELVHPIKVKIGEFEGQVTVTAEMPDFATEEVKIGVKPRQVIIWGELVLGAKTHRWLRPQGAPATLCHTLDLPAEIDPSKASARLADGILKLKLPKVMH
jgi:HSP20 family protein